MGSSSSSQRSPVISPTWSRATSVKATTGTGSRRQGCKRSCQLTSSRPPRWLSWSCRTRRSSLATNTARGRPTRKGRGAPSTVIARRLASWITPARSVSRYAAGASSNSVRYCSRSASTASHRSATWPFWTGISSSIAGRSSSVAGSVALPFTASWTRRWNCSPGTKRACSFRVPVPDSCSVARTPRFAVTGRGVRAAPVVISPAASEEDIIEGMMWCYAGRR
jgi:hypothetical protein